MFLQYVHAEAAHPHSNTQDTHSGTGAKNGRYVTVPFVSHVGFSHMISFRIFCN